MLYLLDGRAGKKFQKSTRKFLKKKERGRCRAQARGSALAQKIFGNGFFQDFGGKGEREHKENESAEDDNAGSSIETENAEGIHHKTA